MFFLIALLLPAVATVLLFRAYPARAARGEAPMQLTVGAALLRGAIAGASALLFLSILGVVIVLYRGRQLTPPGTQMLVFWVVQFIAAAVIGGAVGAVTALTMLASVRERLARTTPVRSFD